MAKKDSGIYYSREEYLKAYSLYSENRRKKQTHSRYLKNKEKILAYNHLYAKKNRKRLTQWQIEWNKKHPTNVLNSQLKMRWGITIEDYSELLYKQKEKCAICFNKETTRNNYNKDEVRRLCVDHCHKTGKIRGLLCNNCNQALGRFNDDVKRIKNAIVYLRKHSRV